MKHHATATKVRQRNAITSPTASMPGKDAAALAPPRYGIAFVDRASAPVAGECGGLPQRRENHTGMPDRLKAGIEALSGLSMDDVNVHYNSSQPAQLDALAYTQGTDIHVAPGQEEHLPHEAWHVVQQAQGRVQPTMQLKDGLPVNDELDLEREADGMGAKAIAMPDAAAPSREPLAERQGLQPVQARAKSAMQGLSRPDAVVQRTLGVGNPVVAADVREVRKVDAKVWVLEGRAGDRVVIKIEVPAGGENAAQFEGRHEYVTWLAQQVLVGVPDAEALTLAEQQVIGGLNIAETGKEGPPTLRSVLNQPRGEVFLKVKHVHMGAHLMKRIEGARAALKKGGKKMLDPQTALLKLITDPGTLKALGQMAVFDLIVNNADRFRPDGTVNSKNIDFSAASQPIAIDNLDPNNRIDANNWPGQARVQSKAGRVGYAAKAVPDIFGQAGKSDDTQGVAAAAANFSVGMEQGVARLKLSEPLLRQRARQDPDLNRQQLGLILAQRLALLQP